MFLFAQLRLNLSEMILRHVEHNRNRLEFSDHHERVRTPRKNGIAGIDESQTNPPGNGSCDVTVTKLDLGKLHLAKVEFDGSLVLNHNLLLVVENLLCDGIRSEGIVVAGKINFRLLQTPAVVIEQAFGLLQLCPVGTRIDVDERIALVYGLPLAIMHGKDLTTHLAEDVYRRNWRHRTESIDIDTHIPSICCSGVNDYRIVCFAGSRGITLVFSRPHRKGDAQHQDGNQTNGPHPLDFGTALSNHGRLRNSNFRDPFFGVFEISSQFADLHEAPVASIVRSATAPRCLKRSATCEDLYGKRTTYAGKESGKQFKVIERASERGAMFGL